MSDKYCNVCCKTFSSVRTYKRHILSKIHKRKENGDYYQKHCDVCCKTFSSVRTYKRHILSKMHKRKENDDDEKDPKYCYECNESFSSKKAKESHMLSSRHRNKKELGDGWCLTCNRHFYDIYSLRNHKKTAMHKRLLINA